MWDLSGEFTTRRWWGPSLLGHISELVSPTNTIVIKVVDLYSSENLQITLLKNNGDVGLRVWFSWPDLTHHIIHFLHLWPINPNHQSCDLLLLHAFYVVHIPQAPIFLVKGFPTSPIILLGIHFHESYIGSSFVLTLWSVIGKFEMQLKKKCT